VGLVGSFVSLYYYLLVLKAIFVDEPAIAVSEPSTLAGSSFLQRGTVAVLAAAVIFLGVIPNGLASRILVAIP
jgi:NADH:ubiquinone oxidoreductase subunit 2 (subunit N)